MLVRLGFNVIVLASLCWVTADILKLELDNMLLPLLLAIIYMLIKPLK
jgi:hypothetical protein